jgi:hypothetical protein
VVTIKVTYSLVDCCSYILLSYSGLKSLTDDAGKMLLRNVDDDLPGYTVSYLRTQYSLIFNSAGFIEQ